MTNIGIVAVNSEKNIALDSLIKSSGYSVIQVTQKNQLKDLDSLVIFSEQKADLCQMSEWITAMQRNEKGFVWIFYPRCSDQEREIYLQLGVNGVVDQAERIGEVSYLIKNTLEKLNYSGFSDRQQEYSQKLIMKESNSSIILDNEEEILLTRLEYKIMLLMYEKVNIAITYETFAQHLWGENLKDEDYQKYRVSNLIYHIREKLGKKNSSLIKTIRSKGYLLII